MSTHRELLEQRRIIDELARLIAIRARLTEINADLARGSPPLTPLERIQLVVELRRLAREEHGLVASLNQANVRNDDPVAERDARQIAHNQTLASLVTDLDCGVPLVLFPIRLETRFLSAAGGPTTEILIRIYPDDVHLNRHEPGLTAEEAQWGAVFWQVTRGPAKAEKERKEAWMHLATHFGPRRGAWIARALDGFRSTAGPRSGDWERAEQADCLPERWLVRGYRADGSRVFEAWTELLPLTLQTGPDPHSPADAAGMTEGMRWMHDFDAAVRSGMAIRRTLQSDEVAALRRLVVFGVKGTLNSSESAQAFFDLLEAHQYTGGLSVVPQGTPTNNTPDARAGRRAAEALRDWQGEDLFTIEKTQIVAPVGEQDGNILARALGAQPPANPLAPTDTERERFPFVHVLGADLTDQHAAAAMNRVLWPATGRYFAEQMIRGGSARRVPDEWGDYFAGYVRGRGPLPALRVGDQPYGLLPTTNLNGLLPPTDRPDLITFLGRDTPSGPQNELRLAWDLGLPAGLGWDIEMAPGISGPAMAAWSAPLPAPPGAGQLTGAALCGLDLNNDGRLEAVLLRDDSDQFGTVRSAIWTAAFGEQGRLAPWSAPRAVPRLSGDESRLPALAALGMESGGAALVLARLGLADGYLRTWSQDGSGPIGVGWSPLFAWTSVLPGALMDFSLAQVDLGSAGSGLALFSLVEQGGMRRLYVQTTPLLDIWASSAVNWSSPEAVTVPDDWLNKPPVARLQVALGDVDTDGTLDLICTALWETDRDIRRGVFVGIGFSVAGSAAEWRQLAPAATAPRLVGSVRGFAATIAELGPSPLPSAGRGRNGWTNLLRWLRDIWRRAAESAPHMGRQAGKADDDLLEVLGQVPASGDIALRPMLGPDYLRNLLWHFQAQTSAAYEDWEQVFAQVTLSQFMSRVLPDLESLQLPSDGRLASSLYGDQTQPWPGPLVHDGPLSETEPLADDGNYLEWLSSKPPRDIHDETYPGGNPPKALLYRLLRHATLQAYADAAVALSPPPNGRRPREYIYEPELVSLQDLDPSREIASSTLTSWRYLTHDVGGQPFDVRLYDHLRKSPKPGEPQPLQTLRAYLADVAFLATLPTAALERLLREVLDLHTHRLDAWITSVATFRLEEMRALQPTGLQLGGYGWVEWAESPLVPNRPKGGFIHAPSLGQATTAAVLRSAYLNHNPEQRGDLLALDLSSRRVRLALCLLEGVRQGRPLAELLGYRFERALHDRKAPNLAQYIDDFRRLAPTGADSVTPQGSTPALADSAAARSVVHGLRLLERWRRGKETGWGTDTIPFGTDGFPNPDTQQTEYAALLDELAAMDDAMDAVADLVLAESVYQVVAGNPTRAGAELTGVSSGETRPPEPEIARTPRSGVGINHRLGVLLPEPGSLPAGWGVTPRSLAEPRLSAWVGRLLGDPARVYFRAEYQDAQNRPLEPVDKDKPFSVASLKLCPLDVLYALSASDPAGRSDLEEQLLEHVMGQAKNRLPATDTAASAKLIFARGPDWSTHWLSVPEWLEMARAGRELIVGARALTETDLLPAGTPQKSVVDAADLAKRWTDSDRELSEAVATLRGLFGTNASERQMLKEAGLASGGASDPNNLLDLPTSTAWEKAAKALSLQDRFNTEDAQNGLLDAIRAFRGFGISGATPVVRSLATEVEIALLVSQAARLVRDAEARRVEAKAAGDPERAVGRPADLARLEALFGGGFRVLPLFTPGAPSWSAFDLRQKASDAGPDAVRPWFRRMASVRKGAARLETALLYAEAAAMTGPASFAVAQFPTPPAGESDRWVGLPIAGKVSFPGGRTSIACYMAEPIDFTRTPSALAGLYIDDWVEVVPNPAEITGLTFHYDAPGAQAPQAILLAVPPAAGVSWSEDLIEATLLETLELAKLRTVDLQTLPGLGQLLPALLFAQNTGGDPHGDTIATNFLS